MSLNSSKESQGTQYIWTLYVSTKETNTLDIDVREEGWDEAAWNAASPDQKDEALGEIFESYKSSLCDYGWFPAKTAKETPEAIRARRIKDGQKAS